MQDQKVNKDTNRVDELCKVMLRDNTIIAVQNSVISCVMVIQMKNEKKVNRVSEFWKKKVWFVPRQPCLEYYDKKNKNKNKNKNKKTKQNKTKDKQTNK